MDMKTLGEFIARERKRQGVSQLELSQAADTGRRFVVDLEAGKETIHAGKMLKILETLGVKVELIAPGGS